MFDKRIFVALAIYFGVMTFLLYVVGYAPPWFLAILLYIVIYAVVTAVWSKVAPSNDEETPELPTSGPIGKFGQAGLIITFTVSGLLSFFNPFQLVQIILQGVGNLYLMVRAEREEETAVPKPNKATYTLPFKGEWYIYNGGITEKKSHSWGILTQRYAYDFVQVDEEMKRHSGAGTQLEQYYCFGKEIVAIGDGEVVKVVNWVRSAPFVGYGIVDFLATNFVGNHIIIKHAEGEYGLYAHLIKGSTQLKVGDKVKRGESVGLCGHSGNSSEPHLHFHLQDRTNFYFGMGLPIQFHDLTIDGTPHDSAYIEAGTIVAPRD